jgi:AcrR family transcriptional regulator
MTEDDKKRLTKEDWILAGFRALSRKGLAGLKAEALARELKTTKGSFYWHFSDVAGFQSAMLEYWQRRATEDIIAELNRDDRPAREQLRTLLEHATSNDQSYGGRRAELALREWGAADERVASVVHDVDRSRIAFLRSRFLLAGLDERNADQAACGLYASLIGFDQLETLGIAEARAGPLAMLELMLGAVPNDCGNI